MDRRTQDQLNEQLFDAVYANDIDTIKQAIEDGADINVADECGITPLHYAAFYGYTQTVEKIIENGANVNAQCDSGLKPLQYAQNTETAELLKQHGGVE